MGVFSITPRSVPLGNIRSSGVRRVNIPNYHIGTGAASMWRAVSEVGRDIVSAGRDMANIYMDMKREQRTIQDNETEMAFLQSMRKKMESPEDGLLRRVETAPNSETLQGCVTEGEDFFKTTADDLLEQNGYSGNRKKIMMQRLARAAMPYQRSMMNGVAKKHTELKVSAADKDFNALNESWQTHMTDEESTQDVIDSFRASQRVRGLADDAVDTNTEKIWQSMAYDYLTKNIGASNRTQLDWLEQHLNDGNGSDLFASNGVLGEHFANKDPLGHTVSHKYGGSVAAKDGVKSMILQRRRELDLADDKAVDMAANLGTTAVAAIRDKDGNYPADRLPNIEQSIETLTKLSKSLPQGGHAATDAAARAADLNKKADSIASEEIFAEYMEELKKDPEAKIFIEETKDKDGNTIKAKNAYEGIPRKERLSQGVQLMVDRQREAGAAEGKKLENEIKIERWRRNMLDGAQSPGEYHAKLMNAGLQGDLTLKQVMDLREEFDEKWVKGFKPGSESPRQILAKTMLGILKKAFPDDALDSSIEYNSKTGKLGFTKDSTYQGLTYERPQGTAKITRRNPDTGKLETIDRTYEGDNTSTLFSWWNKTEKLSAQNVLDIGNAALILADYDGLEFKTDPITGSPFNYVTGELLTCTYDKDGNATYPKFNAATYFSGYLDMIKKQRAIIDAADYVKNIVDAADQLSALQGIRERDSEAKIEKAEIERSAGSKRVITLKKLPSGSAPAKTK